MAPERFDGHIKSKIYHLETDVPDQLWSQIDQKLRPKKHNRGFIWAILGFFFVITAGLFIQLTKAEQGATLKTSLFQDVMQDQQLANSTVQSTNVLEDEGTQVLNTLTDIKEIRAAGETEIHAAQSSTAHFNAFKAPSNAERSSKKTIAARQENRFQHKNLIQVGQERAQSQATTTESGISAKLESVPPGKQSAGTARPPNTRIVLAPLDNKIFHVDLNFKDPLTNNCPSFSAKNSLRPFAELTIGGGVPIRHLMSLSTEGSDYKDLRDRTERIRGVFSARAMIGTDFGNHFEGKIGLAFSQINEVFDFIDESASRTVVNIVTDTIIDSNGNPNVRSDTSIITEYGQRIKLTNNHYRFLDLPVLVGYRFKVKNHGFILQAGASLNLAFWKEADLLAPDESIVNIDSKNSNAYSVFKSTAGIDLLGGIGYNLDVSDRNSVRILASVQYPLSLLTLAEYPLEQKYTQIKLGVSWKHYLW